MPDSPASDLASGMISDSQSRTLPDAEVFLSDPPNSAPAKDQPATTAAASSIFLTPPAQRLPGPGLPESFLWLIGAIVANALGSLLGFALTMMMNPAIWQMEDIAQFKQFLDRLAAEGHLGKENLHIVVLFGLLASALYAVIAVRVCLGAVGLRRLGWKAPAPIHLLAVIGLMLPLSLLCTAFFQEINRVFPNSGKEFEEAMKSFKEAPTSMLIFMLAILPAFWEELFFRGLIGSGLLSRWGLLRGVLWTSLLFGVMHINPAQSVAVIPLGVALHFIYLTTRSLWAPMLLHFLNNAWAVYALKSEGTPSLHDAILPDRLPLPLLTVSLTTATALFLLLWQTRTRYVQPDGDDWTPGYGSLESPDPAAEWLQTVRARPRALLVVCSAICVLGFLGVVVQLAAPGVLASK